MLGGVVLCVDQHGDAFDQVSQLGEHVLREQGAISGERGDVVADHAVDAAKVLLDDAVGDCVLAPHLKALQPRRSRLQSRNISQAS